MFFHLMLHRGPRSSFFFFNDTATTEIYTLSLHDALPICAIHCNPVEVPESLRLRDVVPFLLIVFLSCPGAGTTDRKSTRLNSSHQIISYAVFCLKKKKKHNIRNCDNRSARTDLASRSSAA